ncbi:hypothetical protein HK098_007044, partial [Nowakowskiella sp. JEL0407]
PSLFLPLCEISFYALVLASPNTTNVSPTPNVVTGTADQVDVALSNSPPPLNTPQSSSDESLPTLSSDSKATGILSEEFVACSQTIPVTVDNVQPSGRTSTFADIQQAGRSSVECKQANIVDSELILILEYLPKNMLPTPKPLQLLLMHGHLKVLRPLWITNKQDLAVLTSADTANIGLHVPPVPATDSSTNTTATTSIKSSTPANGLDVLLTDSLVNYSSSENHKSTKRDKGKGKAFLIDLAVARSNSSSETDEDPTTSTMSSTRPKTTIIKKDGSILRAI